jgi:hypothetical protein
MPCSRLVSPRRLFIKGTQSEPKRNLEGSILSATRRNLARSESIPRHDFLTVLREVLRMKNSAPATTSLLLGTAVLMGCIGAAQASADDSPTSQSFGVSISASFTAFEVVDTYTCRGGNPGAPAPTERPKLGGYGYCAYTSHGNDVFWGDLDGTTTFASGGVVHAYGAIPYSSVITFTGTVAGCGAGTFTFRSSGKIETMVLEADGNYQDVGPWVIEKSSGTGELAGIAGGGTIHTTIAQDFSSAWGTLSGTVSCL